MLSLSCRVYCKYYTLLSITTLPQHDYQKAQSCPVITPCPLKVRNKQQLRTSLLMDIYITGPPQTRITFVSLTFHFHQRSPQQRTLRKIRSCVLLNHTSLSFFCLLHRQRQSWQSLNSSFAGAYPQNGVFHLADDSLDHQPLL
jgi:hypothetical protein